MVIFIFIFILFLLIHFLFFFFGGGGSKGGGSKGGVEVLPGWLPDNTGIGIQWEMSNLGEGDKPPLLFSI